MTTAINPLPRLSSVEAAGSMTLTLAQVIRGLRDLPPLPDLLLQLLSGLDDENLRMDALADRVSQDVALTAKILRLANSSYYGRGGRISTMRDGVTLLGVRTVRMLVIAASLTSRFGSGLRAPLDLRALWRHSMGVAVCAKEYAALLGSPQELAFTSGLLHDIGVLVLMHDFPDHYVRVLAWQAQHPGSLLDAERAVLDLDHLEVGLALAKEWRFADDLRDAIALHHREPSSDFPPTARIIYVANAQAKQFGWTNSSYETPLEPAPAPWLQLGVSEEAFHRANGKAVDALPALTEALIG